MIDFDADAYMAAAAGPEAARDFFYSRMVLSEGARVRCHKPGMEFGQQVRRGALLSGMYRGWCGRWLTCVIVLSFLVIAQLCSKRSDADPPPFTCTRVPTLPGLVHAGQH